MTREEEIKLVADCHIADSIENYKEFYEGFIHGAKWADKTMLYHACEWLSIYYPNIDRMGIDEFINAFRQAMKGGTE